MTNERLNELYETMTIFMQLDEFSHLQNDCCDIIDFLQSAKQPTSGDVQEAIEWLENERESILHYASLHVLPSGQMKAEESYRLAITALQAYKEPCDLCQPDVMDGNPITFKHSSGYVGDGKFSSAGRIAKHCPLCGRLLKGE